MCRSGLVLVVLFGLLSFSNCTNTLNKKPAEPAHLIPRDTMVNIIVDLRLMDATIVYRQRKGDRSKADLPYLLNNTIMNKYGITHGQFDSSFFYYESDLRIMDQIFADAITKLTLMQTELGKE